MQTNNIDFGNTHFYHWQNYRCAYQVYQPTESSHEGLPLLLIHPIGVGLSGKFWQRFCREWYATGQRNLIYNPDLLGCGESDKPHIAYTPKDWAEQLHYFLQTVIKTPVILVVQGGLLPVALELLQLEVNLIAKLVLSGPPTWPVITKKSPDWRQRLAWNIFDSPVGNAFYRYARTPKFLSSFSTRSLFASGDTVDAEWLDSLVAGAANPATRHAVFSFLAGFWRQDYTSLIAAIKQPTLVVLGESASSISKEGKAATADDTLADYLACLPQGRGVKIPGRNVLPYESTSEFVRAIAQINT
ncbi:alpha/beta fold hydrolase [Anabaena subtropica]|uniref:Alpha/beta hydrolase n=1 Tax=Anabaena subtropica FACHB-260 TaxID=2692884 RepID=A0ABR8CQW9_9NOST|nr:alpha/beta hydrolase [Anabaena subtropica]MBD2344577.1 alpha/beta hydrolase [Anabaena subtropica FACHB-260]